MRSEMYYAQQEIDALHNEIEQLQHSLGGQQYTNMMLRDQLENIHRELGKIYDHLYWGQVDQAISRMKELCCETLNKVL